jgi:hypothetical protein
MNNFDAIEKEIINALNTFLAEVETRTLRGDANWTRRIKEVLDGLGDKIMDENNRNIFEQGCNENEWLYDFVLYEIDETDSIERLQNILLVAEIEWNKSLLGIKYDFEKLLVANAEHRLMICQAKPNRQKQLEEYFEKAINSYRLLKQGDRFMIAILDADLEEEFTYKVFIK